MSTANGNGKLQARNDAALGDVFAAVDTRNNPFEQQSNGLMGFRLPKQSCEELYRIPICRRICRAKADYAILKGWELSVGGKSSQKIINGYNGESDRLKIAQRFNEAQVQANIYGGAVLAINIDDGRYAWEPVDEANIKSVRSLTVLDRYKITPVLNLDTSSLAEPIYYQLALPVSTRRSLPELGQGSENDIRADYVHCSRIIRFDGISLPPDMLAINDGWGMSLLESIWEDFRRWQNSLQSLDKMLEDFSIFTYEISKLGELQDEYGQDALVQRFQAFKRGIKTLGAAAIDKENEKISYTARQMGGIDAIADKLRDAFIGASGLPHTKLFGESPSGLGASGESEEKDWAGAVAAFQQSDWHPKLRPFLRYIFLAKESVTKGKVPEDWSIRFINLIQQSESELAQLRSTQAQTDNTYLGMGALLVDEVRNSRFGGSIYSTDTVLDPQAWEKSKEQPPDAFGGDFGMNGEVLPEELPPEEVPVEDPLVDEEAIAATDEEPATLDSLRFDAVNYADLEKKDGKVQYLGRWWEVDQPIKSDRQGKKYMVLAKKGKEVKLLHFGAEGYKHNYSKEAKSNYLKRSAGIRDGDGNLTKDDKFSPNYWARKVLWARNKPADGSAKLDSKAPPIKRILRWNGLNIGVTHDPSDYRFPGSLPMVAHYGHLRGSFGDASDKLAHDFYVQANADLDQAKLFKIRQNDPNTGFKDEEKYFIASSPDIARSLYQYHAGRDRFGGIDPIDISELDQYRTDTHLDACDCEVCAKKKRRKKKQTQVNTDASDEKEPIDHLIDKTLKDSAEPVNDWLTTAKSWMDNFESLEEMRDRLPELFGQLDGDRFAELVEKGNILAYLEGMDSAEENE